jgi:flavodoxin
MKIKLLYYSGAGNTKYIANIIEKTLTEKNHIVNSIKITENNIEL